MLREGPIPILGSSKRSRQPVACTFDMAQSKVLVALALCASPVSAFVAPQGGAASSALNFGLDDLKSLAEEQNPVVGYFDPLNLGEAEYWDQSNEATIGFLRHAEIKHGRVAMAGFVGFCVHAKGITWGFPMTLKGDKWPELGDGGVPALWDQLPAGAKWQIVGFVGALEFWGEYGTSSAFIGEARDGEYLHYMQGGVPGKYPPFQKPLPFNLYFGLGAGKKSEEELARGRNIEINNGRLAMIGLMGLLSECVTPGSVTFLDQFNFPKYAGNVMIPFEGNFNLFSAV